MINKNKTIFVRVTEEEYNTIKNFADKETRTISNYLLLIIRNFLKEKEDKNEIDKNAD